MADTVTPALCSRNMAAIWIEEAPTFMPVSRPFDGFVEYSKRAPDLPRSPGAQPLQRDDRHRKPSPIHTLALIAILSWGGNFR
jgi:hypothetical protein